MDSGGNLWVADSANSRVLRFPRPFDHTGQTQTADLVLGQDNFTSRITDATSHTMSAPYGLAFSADGHLVVSDAAHNRVLLFKKPFSSGKAADRVFGQNENDFSTTTPGTLNSPRHVALDSNDRLYVADYGNNRVDIFSQLLVGGSTVNPTFKIQTSLPHPIGVFVNKNNNDAIWVTSAGRNQVYRYVNYAALQLSGEVRTGTLGDKPQLLQLISPYAVGMDGSGNLLLLDATNRMMMFFPPMGLQNAANYFTDLSPGTIAVAYPQGQNVTGSPKVNDQASWPKTLADTQVLVNGVASPLYYVYPKQLAFLIPSSTPESGVVTFEIVSASTGQLFAAGSASMFAVAPGLFTSSQTGSGAVAALNISASGAVSINGPNNPAERGAYVALYGTGYGVIPGAPPDGEPSTGQVWTPGEKPIIAMQDWPNPIQGDEILYSGLAPYLPGLWQVNFKVPNIPTAAVGEKAIGVLFHSISSVSDPNTGQRVVTTIYIK